ncbi:MAG TPA: autotransporter outer membrane beta-barrel domain-containing protein, partial [Steroidobacteraceae bacterium]|nr:autotransporter outer membrane beta-barrel domain-containing protein [Steroidobacteraceae bacterium]
MRYRHAPHTGAPETALSFSGGSGGLGALRIGAAGAALGFSELPAAPPSPRFPTQRAPRAQAWMLGIGAESENDAIAGFTAFDTDTKGFMLGGDRRVGEDWLLGVTFGQSKTDVVTGDLATGDIEWWQGSIYATWFDERYHFEAGAAYGEQDFKDSRALLVDSVIRNANSAHDGDAWNVFAGGGVSFGNERWSIEPYVSLNYISATEEAFEEAGAASMNLLVPAQDTRALFGEAGAAFSVRHPLNSALIDWHASLAVGHDFGIDDGTLFYSYAGAPLDVFSIDGRPVKATSALYGVGVSFLGDQSVLSIDFQGARNSDRVEKYLSARVVVRF